jgi:hypothetical protein
MGCDSPGSAVNRSFLDSKLLADLLEWGSRTIVEVLAQNDRVTAPWSESFRAIRVGLTLHFLPPPSFRCLPSAAKPLPQYKTSFSHGIKTMSRVNDALSSLVGALIPALPGEDEASADQRHDEALELTKEILGE